MASKYLTVAQMNDIMGQYVIDKSFQPMSQDSYNELLVVQGIKNTGRMMDLLYAAITMAIIGYGGGKLGNYKLLDKIVEIFALLSACGVKIGLGKNAKLEEGDLTPQRLCRAFRNQIRTYIVETKMQSYICRKYSDQDPKYAQVLFRGSEYLDNLSPDEVAYILTTYANMDATLQLNISDRVHRVFQAKGYVKRALTQG